MLTQSLTLTNDLAELTRLADVVDEFCARAGAAPQDVHALQLALEEVVTNVITHGYTDGGAHTFTVVLAFEMPRVTATVTDDAPAYDPLARAEVDTTLPLEQRPIGGLGVHLVKKLMDSVQYERHGSHNVLTVTRTLHPPS